MITTLKYRLIKLADWIDDHLLDHRFYPWLCDRIAFSDWWGDGWNEKEWQPPVRKPPTVLEYDPQTDSLDILLSIRPVEESREIEPGVIVDYDSNGKVVSIEILGIFDQLSKWRPLE